jgi:serine protease DegS/serine protease DegQ
MARTWRVLLFVLQAVTVGLALAFVLTRLMPERFAAPAPGPAAEPTAISPSSYRSAVERARPSVVNIYTRRVVPYLMFGDPVFQRSLRLRREASLGAGVIVSADGYVLTNNHVVSNAQEIYLGLWDGRVTRAQIVGNDPDTDLAVLKLDGTNLPAATFADASDPLAVGDVVLAIGNPLGMGQTVTLGIVSATGRNQLSLSRYEDFIQTDAAINVGNSGGALVDTRGELVGINTAMFSQGGGVQGISFAIPAAAARRVLEQIVARGYVVRGWIGAEYADVAYSASPVRDGSSRGVQVVALLPGGPADRAGLRAGDVLLRFDGVDIDDEGDLRNAEAQRAPGSTAVIEGQRAGVPLRVEVTLAERPRRDVAR